MNLGEIANRAVKLAVNMGATEAEAYVRRSVNKAIKATRERIENITAGVHIELGLRVVIGKRVAIYGTDIAEFKDLKDAVKYVIKMAEVAPEDPKWVSLPKELGASEVEKVFDENIANPDVGEFIRDLHESLASINQIDRRAYPVETWAEFLRLERTIVNSYGEEVSDKLTRFILYSLIKAKDSVEEAGYYDVYTSTNLEGFNLAEFMKDLAKTTVMFLGARRIPSGRYKVLLKGRVFGAILNALIAPAIVADWVQKGRSPLANRLGAQIFSEDITIVDDGTAPACFATSSFDEEGVPTKRKVIFERGVLNTYLYDNYTASIEGRESTGNASRRNISSAPSPWITNLFVLPGDASYDEMVESIDRGIIVYGTIGEWLSNPVSGFLNATVANGLYVEKGEVRYPVKSIVIGGDIYKLLSKNVSVLSKQIESRRNIHAPHVLLEDISIAGK